MSCLCHSLAPVVGPLVVTVATVVPVVSVPPAGTVDVILVRNFCRPIEHLQLKVYREPRKEPSLTQG